MSYYYLDPFKIKAQCRGAKKILGKNINDLTDLKNKINTFTDETNVESESFLKLKDHFREYISVIDEIIDFCNREMDKFRQLEDSVDNIVLDGDVITRHMDRAANNRDTEMDRADEYFTRASIVVYSSMRAMYESVGVMHNKMAEYYDREYLSYVELEELYRQIDDATKDIFGEGAAEAKMLTEKLIKLKNAFTISTSTVPVPPRKSGNQGNNPVGSNRGEGTETPKKNSSGGGGGGTSSVAEPTETNPVAQAEPVVTTPVSGAGSGSAVVSGGYGSAAATCAVSLSKDGYDDFVKDELSDDLIKYDEDGNIVAIKNHDLGNGGVTLGYGIFVAYDDEEMRAELAKRGISCEDGDWVPYDVICDLFCERNIGCEKAVESIAGRNNMNLTQNQFDSLYRIVHARPELAKEGGALDSFFESGASDKESFIEMLENEYKRLKGWAFNQSKWTGKIKKCAKLFFDEG